MLANECGPHRSLGLRGFALDLALVTFVEPFNPPGDVGYTSLTGEEGVTLAAYLYSEGLPC